MSRIVELTGIGAWSLFYFAHNFIDLVPRSPRLWRLAPSAHDASEPVGKEIAGHPTEFLGAISYHPGAVSLFEKSVFPVSLSVIVSQLCRVWRTEHMHQIHGMPSQYSVDTTATVGANHLKSCRLYPPPSGRPPPPASVLDRPAVQHPCRTHPDPRQPSPSWGPSCDLCLCQPCRFSW